MIAFLQGEIDYVTENSVVVNCRGVGYEVSVSAADLSQMPEIGSEVRIYTYLNINENSGIGLFGFLNRDDLAMFKLLITVSGIGPKGAQSILSGMTADTLRFAILAEDAKTISKAPGIGAKTAQKLVLELKDKVSLEETFEHSLAAKSSKEEDSLQGAKEEAVLALVSLGYSKTEATHAVSKVPMSEGITVDEVLSQSLKFM